jgi:hypothetical protein
VHFTPAKLLNGAKSNYAAPAAAAAANQVRTWASICANNHKIKIKLKRFFY